jgi:hypothetical protein
MRILGAIVFAQSLFVTRGQPEFGFCGCVGAKPIGDQKFRRKTLLFEQLSHEFHGGGLIAPSLDEKVKDLAFVVNRSPQPEMPTCDRDHNLIKMPARRRPRSSIAQFLGELRSKLRHPSSNSFVGDVETAFGEQVLDVSQAECEAKIQPNGVLDHRRRKLMAGIGDRHAPFYRLNRSVSGFV